MSALGGVMYFGIPPVPMGVLSILANALAPLGPDGCMTVVSGPAGFVYRAFHTTSRSLQECQPFDDTLAMIAIDGRIDNRAELFSAFSDLDARAGDAALVARAYTRWGTEFCRHLVGEYAIAIWDKPKRLLMLARDPFGTRPLFYHSRGGRVVWASSTAALLSCPDVQADIDEHHVADFLALIPDGLHSPFQGITPVRTGCTTIFRRGTPESHTFWDASSFCVFDDTVRSDEEYEEEFRYHFFDSVRVRLESDGPVLAELSGGLDSSSVVCVADEIRRQNPSRYHPVHTISRTFREATSSDEREFITSVERQRGRRGTYIWEDEDPMLSNWLDYNFISHPNIDFCASGYVRHTLRCLDRYRSRVLLSGFFGDQLLLESWIYRAADCLRAGHLANALSTCYNWSSSHGESLLSILWRSAIRPNLPYWLRRSATVIPDWIEPEFARTQGLRERQKGVMEPRLPGSRGLRCLAVQNSLGPLASGYISGRTSFTCYEVRYPFLHRPLIEFLLGLPTSQLARPSQNRYIQRAALRNILPEHVRLRKSKRGPHQALMIAISRQRSFVSQLLNGSSAAARGFVDTQKLRNHLEQAIHGQSSGASRFPRFIALEIWLRLLERKEVPIPKEFC